MRLQEIVLRTVRLPLIRPYVLSYRTFTEFEPIIVEVRDADARVGWGEGHISPGSSSETRDGGWTFCREHAAAVIGKDSSEAKAIIARDLAASKVAATALVTAIEMLEGHPLLSVDRDTRLPLLTPFNSSAPGDIEREVEQRLKDGFRTFKIKVGKSAEDDARRVKLIQRAIAGRATMRLDANRAYSEADACRFAMALDPAGIELFEQPCPAEDWERCEACLRNCERGLLQAQAQAFWRPRSASRGARRGSRMGNGSGARRSIIFGAWVLDGGLCRARHHSQCRRVQRISETECTPVLGAIGVRGWRACAAVGVYSHDRCSPARSARDGV